MKLTPPLRAARLPVILLSLMFFVTSCDRTTFEIPSPEAFSKSDREKLGQVLFDAMRANNQFQFLPETAPYDSTVYWYLQNLYDQATLPKRHDNQSPSGNRWNPDRKWKVRVILDDDLKTAFTLPGGDFFITTGFLKLFKEDFELYYVLCFESVLMNDRYLLTRLVEEYNSLTLVNLIQGNATANQVSAGIISADLVNLIFGSDVVREVDARAVADVCETSVFEKQGIVPLLNTYHSGEVDWLRTRETYTSRATNIALIGSENGQTCGSVRSTGKYKKMVLEMLP
ncbi:MAG: hypothetical protein D6714_12610 [Bacteroidetes bacterium]|nr:MAG: hypothetical protein D6714_12610 [Bacteroidota bacterium]